MGSHTSRSGKARESGTCSGDWGIGAGSEDIGLIAVEG
jgi:hypothetical protein